MSTSPDASPFEGLLSVFTAAPVAMALLDADLRPVLVNPRMRELDLHPDRGLAGRVLASASEVTDVDMRTGDRSFRASYAPVEVEGRVLGVVCTAVETTAHLRLLARSERLQAVTEQLSAALTKEEVAAIILQESLDATGGTCAVLALLTGDETLRLDHRLGMAAGAPAELPAGAQAPMPEAARTGKPVLIASRAEWLRRYPQVPPRGDFQAFAAIPLLFEEQVAGVMGLGYPHRRTLHADDVGTLLAIGRQGAQALERARLYEERAYVARTLQAGLLPRALPGIEGFELAVRYWPIGDGSEVGGDFYDVVPLDDGSWLVAVGDICGKGTAAAVLTGVMRSTIRALALHEIDPGRLLAGVNEALLRESSAEALASMACARIAREADGVHIRIAVGGHPPPLVLRRGGMVDVVTARGPLLGVEPRPTLELAEERLVSGDLLLLYTDGVIDARRTGSEPFGEARLQAALATGAGRDAQGALDLIDAAVRAYAPGPPRDDKALLAVRAA